MAEVWAVSMVGGTTFLGRHAEKLIHRESLRASVLHPLTRGAAKHSPGHVCLDNAFALIERHPHARLFITSRVSIKVVSSHRSKKGEFERVRHPPSNIRIGSIILAVAMGLFPSNSRANKHAYTGSIPFDNQELLIGKECYVFGGTVSSGDYFVGLERTDKDGEVRFWRMKKEVKTYPPQLDVIIRISTLDCSILPAERPTVEFDIGSQWDSLKFTAQWKDNLRSIPADLTFIGSNQRSDVYGFGLEIKKFEVQTYEFHLAVTSRDVSLLTHLIVRINGPDGGRIMRLSAKP
jgi:hypothetical protein